MKKFSLLFIGVLSMSSVFAQDITDAIRYSSDEVQGTARFRSMSGAFGALGGDMSAVSINPAGSAIFTTSHASISLSSLNTKNDVRFFNGFNSSSESKIDLNQTGAAFVFQNSSQDSAWKKFVLSVAYDKTSDYEDNWLASGNNTNSIDNYFLAFTQNQAIPFGVLKLQPGELLEEGYANIGSDPNYGYEFQQAFLGYWSGIIDPLNLDNDTNNDNIDYVSNIAPGSFNQNYQYISTGYNGKFAFNVATQYNDKLYFGLNLNSHFINYERFTGFTETNSNEGSVVNNVLFENSLYTTGNGFSFQLGTIAKLTEELRLGFTYNSPTWYTINEELVQNINSNNADIDIGYIATVRNIFPDYKLQTPGKLTGSFAYVFGERGLISFDYSLKDYGNIKFKPTSDPYFASQNNIINNNLKVASTYRIGGEYRYKEFSFRGGYRLEESPYENEDFYGDLNGFSLGLGYNFGNIKLDLAFDHSDRTINNQLYSVGLTDAAIIDSKKSNVTLTLGFSL
ncbi:MAG: outer membrane protein transport protein [Gelidibacter sp.]